MDRAQIQAEWDKFIEYPSDDKRIVTTTSALLFAEHIAKLQATQEPAQAGELPEPELGYIKTDKSNQPAYSARQMRAALREKEQAK